MTFLLIVLASLAVSAVSFSGGLMLLNRKLFSETSVVNTLVSFAAGTMLAAAFFDLLPEAMREGGEELVFGPMLAGIVTFFFLERFVLWFHHHHDGHGAAPAGPLVLIGDAVHNFIDGVGIAAAFVANPVVGLTTTLAMAAHEIPQEIADLSVLVKSGFGKTRALLANFASGLTALLGAVIAYFFMETIEGLTWILLSFTAGMFVYIACSDLIPDLHKEFADKRRWIQSVPFLIGIAVIWLFVTFLHAEH